MPKITEEQLREGGAEIQGVMYGVSQNPSNRTALEVGRAAYEYFRPLVLAEALEPLKQVHGSQPDVEGCWNPLNIQWPDLMGLVNKILANRLARLTAKPDPAVEAVLKSGLIGSADIEAAQRLVAAVDAARSKK